MDKPISRLLRYGDLAELNIVSNRTTLRRWIANRGFPSPIRLGPNTLAWLQADIEAWLARPPAAVIVRARSAG